MVQNKSGGVISRLGIMGGTFDPIHYGHLVTAECARHEFCLDRVVFVPSARPPHKKAGQVTDADHRYRMTLLAVDANPAFEVSRIEIDRQGYSFTIDTVREFRRLYGEKTEIFFITGADAILEIMNWKSASRLIELCSFIAATRPGFDLTELSRLFSGLPREYGEKIHPMEVPALAISSTDIRRRVREGRPIKYLLPDLVELYLRKHCLYDKGKGL